MTTPAVATSSAAESSAPSLAESVGELFGDFTGGGETPDPTESAAGTTPAEPAAEAGETASEPVASGDGTDASASEGTTPDAQAPVVEDDPFKDTQPASYMLNGTPVPVEDIRVFKEGGAVIRPESLPNVLSKLAERDTLSERVRTRDAEYNALAKATEWTGSDNQTITGPQAAVERIVAHAAAVSENDLIVSEVLKCPDLHAAGFLTTELRPDGKGGQYEAVIFRPDALARLQTQNELRQLKATQAIRDHYGKLIASAAQPSAPPVDYAAAAPGLIADLAKASNLDASVLTAGDRSILAKQLPFHTRDGKVSLEWQELVKDRIADRAASKASSQKLVTTTTDAVKKGQAAMAAAARGVKQTPAKTPAAPLRQPSPQAERSQNEGEAFDALLSSGAAAMRAAR